MHKKEHIKMIPSTKRSYLSIVICLLIFLALVVSTAYSGDFKLIKIDSHYEPELKNKEELAIILPDTDISAALYRYNTDDGGYTGKVGFLLNKKKFYFLQSNRSDPSEEQYGLSGDVTYGVYRNYFLLEASAGGTTRNSNLFLFKYNKNEVQFLDAIDKAAMSNHELLDFISSTKKIGNDGYPLWGHRSPVWMDIGDIDGDGRPEIKLLISKGFKFEPYFMLYLEIKDERLKIDLNPHLYKLLFAQEKHKSETKTINDKYYIYGFLAKELTLDEIKNTLKNNRQELIILIENIEKLNEAFHERTKGEEFALQQYHLKRR